MACLAAKHPMLCIIDGGLTMEGGGGGGGDKMEVA